MIKLKICGMRDAANIEAVAEFRPDYMGFIFYKGSPRYVGENFSVNADVERVGVFVNETTSNILERLKELRSTTAQLHGDEMPLQCAELRSKGIKVIKVFSIDDDSDFAKTKDYETDYFLFDTKGKLYGGNSMIFNWKKLQEYDQRIPFFLSGGLNAENVKGLDSLKGMNLHAVDLNSGVEDAPGLKNLSKVHEVMQLIKALNIDLNFER